MGFPPPSVGVTIDDNRDRGELCNYLGSFTSSMCSRYCFPLIYNEGAKFEAPAPDHEDSSGAGLGEENLDASWSL